MSDFQKKLDLVKFFGTFPRYNHHPILMLKDTLKTFEYFKNKQKIVSSNVF